jgi:hypothetical protein
LFFWTDLCGGIWTKYKITWTAVASILPFHLVFGF